MRRGIGGATLLAGVAGRPIGHSLSPRLHNAWIEAAGLDAAYLPFSPAEDRFCAMVDGFRGGLIRGLNITLPFKEKALAVADDASPGAEAAGAANLLLFHPDGRVEARNTDGQGLLYAFARQAPDLDLVGGPVVILGAGGAARAAAASLQARGAPEIRIVNRTLARASALAAAFDGASAWSLQDADAALKGALVIINATSAELNGGGLALDFKTARTGAAAMDMLYRPLRTGFLKRAEEAGLRTVDGIDMLIGQAIPSFEALFGAPPPVSVDARAVLLSELDPG